MTGPLDIRTARRRYITVCVLFWLPLRLTIAPGILLFTERGMALAAIAGLARPGHRRSAVHRHPCGRTSSPRRTGAACPPHFRTLVNPCGRFEPDMNRQLPLGPLLPQQPTPQDHSTRTSDAMTP